MIDNLVCKITSMMMFSVKKWSSEHQKNGGKGKQADHIKGMASKFCFHLDFTKKKPQNQAKVKKVPSRNYIPIFNYFKILLYQIQGCLVTLKKKKSVYVSENTVVNKACFFVEL